MPFSSYTGRPWKVIDAAPDSKCLPGTLVWFSGTPDKVIIQCDGETPYQEGVYIDRLNTIERADGYAIYMIPALPIGQIISFNPKGSVDSAGGSWTADDNVPGSGDS
jgi:hypothetical protein